MAASRVSRRLASDRDFRARFDREAHLVSRLNHPNICTLYDVGRQDSLDYLVIEYIEKFWAPTTTSLDLLKAFALK